MSSVPNPVIVVGGGLAGLSAAHQIYARGGNVVLLDKQPFLSGNSGKATLGINGAGTRAQDTLKIRDLAAQFLEDTVKSGHGQADPALAGVLTKRLAEAVHWLQDEFSLDLSVVSRLGGHLQPRTHRGHDAKFPGMAITYRLLERLENIAEAEPLRVAIWKSHQVIDLETEDGDPHAVLGVRWKNLKTKEKGLLHGPVIMATGGYAADFTRNSLLRKYRPDIFDLPSTNGVHATGDGQKIVLKHHGVGVDLDKVQVHPTGLVDLSDEDVISGKSAPRFLFLGAEALRGEGGIMLNADGDRFCDELGTRDYVSGEMEKQLKSGKGPLRLVLNSRSEESLGFHIRHYTQRNLMKTVLGAQLAAEMKVDPSKLAAVIGNYDKSAAGDGKELYGKKYFPNTPFGYDEKSQYHVSFVTRVLHFTMGGIKINDRTQVVYENDGKFTPFSGLYAAGEVAGQVHGHNRLGGSSLLACVVFGRLAGDIASSHVLQKLAAVPIRRLQQISLHVDPQNPYSVTVDWGSGPQTSETPTVAPKQEALPSQQPSQGLHEASLKPLELVIPEKEFTPEEVAKHKSRDDCWVIVKNVVLDLTLFLEDHPGGSGSIMAFAGKDATESFDMLHEDSVIGRYARKCVLGRVKGAKPQLQS